MESILALVVAAIILVLIPGPNVALIVANSLRYGFRSGLVTTLGTTSGLALQLLLVVAGMATVINVAATAFNWIRWLGVLYLLYLGIRAWREPATDLQGIRAAPPRHHGIFWRGFGLAVINPKTLLFNAAFLPQFVVAGEASVAHLSLLAAIYLAIIVTGDTLWATFASSARQVLGKFGHLRNKITGGFLLGAAASLALSRRAN